MTLTETLLDNPVAVSGLASILGVLIWYLRGVGPRQAIALDRVRRPVWRLAHPVAKRESVTIPTLRGTITLPMPGRPLLRDKTGADDEYITTFRGGLIDLLRLLWTFGFRYNPLSTVKYRELPDGRRQYGLSVVYRPSSDADWQQDIHIFFATDGPGYDILGHDEPNVTNPTGHVGGEEQVPGDPRGVVRKALSDERFSGFEE